MVKKIGANIMKAALIKLIGIVFVNFALYGYIINKEKLTSIDTIVERALEKKEIPGCVILIGQQHDIVYKKAYGNAALFPKIKKTSLDTLYDIASLTKIFTAASVIMAAEKGLLRLSAPIKEYLPELDYPEKELITIKQLLLHSSGLQNPTQIIQGNVLQHIYQLPPSCQPGTQFIYTDIGYILLGQIITKVSGRSLTTYMKKYLFDPLGMHETFFCPQNHLIDRIAPTNESQVVPYVGQVHDPIAHQMGGIAGHAGLFSTVDDLAIFCQMILNEGMMGNKQIMSRFAIQAMLRPWKIDQNNFRALGFDMQTRYSSNFSDFFPFGTCGHSGFTGTSLVIDPMSKIYIIILSNRVHSEFGDCIPLRAAVANIVASAIV